MMPLFMPQTGPPPLLQPPIAPPVPVASNPASRSFSEVSGLEVEDGEIEYRTESEETVQRKIPTTPKHPNIYLKQPDLEGIKNEAFKEADSLKKSLSSKPNARDMVRMKSGYEFNENMH
ncbi:MAG: hypothetical protein HYZ85_03040 [Candidatus Omnitrophica bacterium]|nr:hypothetical protein [Candidatus Omnitrophota bacterium]